MQITLVDLLYGTVVAALTSLAAYYVTRVTMNWLGS